MNDEKHYSNKLYYIGLSIIVMISILFFTLSNYYYQTKKSKWENDIENINRLEQEKSTISSQLDELTENKEKFQKNNDSLEKEISDLNKELENKNKELNKLSE